MAYATRALVALRAGKAELLREAGTVCELARQIPVLLSGALAAQLNTSHALSNSSSLSDGRRSKHMRRGSVPMSHSCPRAAVAKERPLSFS